jgi:Fic family protein
VHNHNSTKVTKYETNVDQASNINVDTTNFSQNLSTADNTVQKALEKNIPVITLKELMEEFLTENKTESLINQNLW